MNDRDPGYIRCGNSSGARTRCTAGDSHGFTLLEVLVATIILVVLLGSIYSAYTTNLEMVEIARESSLANQAARIVLERMTIDIESAFITPPRKNANISLGMRLVDGRIDDRPADRIDFTTTTRMETSSGAPRADLCEAGYYLEKDSEDAGLVLHRREDCTPDTDFSAGGIRFELARGVTGLEITVTDESGSSHEEWETPQGDLAAPPALVSIKLTLMGQDGHERLFRTSIHPAVQRQSLGGAGQ